MAIQKQSFDDIAEEAIAAIRHVLSLIHPGWSPYSGSRIANLTMWEETDQEIERNQNDRSGHHPNCLTIEMSIAVPVNESVTEVLNTTSYCLFAKHGNRYLFYGIVLYTDDVTVYRLWQTAPHAKGEPFSFGRLKDPDQNLEHPLWVGAISISTMSEEESRQRYARVPDLARRTKAPER